jgi:hypothetical protein
MLTYSIRTPLLRHPVARGALGHGLALDVGADAGFGQVGPVGLGEVVHAAPAAVGDGGHRRSHHEAPHARRLGGTQRAQGTVAGRHDQIVGVLGHAGGQGRSDVGDVAATGHRVGPAGVAVQVGGKELQAAVVHRQQLAHRGFTIQAAHRGVHHPAFGDELTDQEAGDVAAAAGDQNLGCHVDSSLPMGRAT